MRTHGEPSFPDPKSAGGFELRNININSAQYHSAARACGKGSGFGPSAAQQHQDSSQLLKYATCMRAHGIRNFPDPTQSGGGVTMSGLRKLDPNSPQFQAANQACHQFLPAGSP